MKKSLFLSLMLMTSGLLFAQNTEEDEKEKGFKRDQLFIGTGVNLGFFNGFILGLNPEIGYSLNRFVDVGIGTNVNLITQNDPNSPTTYRQWTFGGGPFVRVWPVNMLFIGGQFEYNSIAYSVKSGGDIVYKENRNAPSILVGAGYGNRTIGGNQFYTSIMVDVLRNPNSPYIDSYRRLQPVFRTTFLFYFKPKRER
ncbi:hypothetical protein WG954_09070 [Lacibacter sp. H375]|uniref:hypothetical protein n=1 Tax=Lacibacter sp. H375 TaxID=3133424 RepID=UPI0030BDED96